MNVTQIVDVAIGLFLLYVVLSLICTSVTEFISKLSRMRAKGLVDHLKEILGDEKTVDLFSHAAVLGLGKTPSYIPSRTFSIALLDKFTTGAKAVGDTFGQVRMAVQNSLDMSNKSREWQFTEVDLFPRHRFWKMLARLVMDAEQGQTDFTLVLRRDRRAVARYVREELKKAGASSPDSVVKALNTLLSDSKMYDSARFKEVSLPESVRRLAEGFASTPPTLDELARVNRLLLEAAFPKGVRTRSRPEEAVLALMDAAGKDLDKARRNVEDWFDDAMERVRGRYKRWSQAIILLTGLVITVITNADTFGIAKRLWNDALLRTTLAEVASDVVAEAVYTDTLPDKPPKAESVENAAPTGSTEAASAVSDEDADSSKAQAPRDLTFVLDRLNKRVSESKVQLPLGWAPDLRADNVVGWLLKILGWFITALALSLGAPFWFDLLGKLVNLKGAGKTPLTAAARAKDEGEGAK